MPTTEPQDPQSTDGLFPQETWLSQQLGIDFQMTPQGLVWNLAGKTPDGKKLSDTCHMLVPRGHVIQVDPNWRPTLSFVHLDEEEHSYAETNAEKIGGKHQRALNAKGISKIATAAGITFEAPIIDDMGNAGIRVTAIGTATGPDGRPKRETATRTVRFARAERIARRQRLSKIKKSAEYPDNKWAQPLLDDPAALEEDLLEAVDKAMEHIDSKVETMAKNRVLRFWLSINSTYPAGSINAKPFLVCQWVFTPDYTNPVIGKIIDAAFGRASAAFDGITPVRSLPPGVNAYGELPAGDPDPEDEDLYPAAPDDDDPEGEPIHEDVEIIEVKPTPPPPKAEGPPGAPPRPDRVVTFKHGPYTGQDIDKVVVDPDGFRWVAQTAADLTVKKARQVLLDWLSWATERVVKADECAELAKQSDEQIEIPF